MEATVSVVIPAYNAGRFIVRALASIEAQTCKPREVVVADDGSTDDTPLRVREFIAHSALNIIFTQQRNQGSAAARNNGIGKSSGELIAFMDADDLMYPRFLERTRLGLARYQHWAVCFSDRDVVDMDGNFVAMDLNHPAFKALLTQDLGDGYVEIIDDALFSKMVTGSPIPMTIVCRRSEVEAINGFDPQLRFNEDMLFMLRLIKRGGRFGYAKESLGIWQRHDANKTAPHNALAQYKYSDLVLAKVIKDDISRLSPRDLTAIRFAQARVARGWFYMASHAGSAVTFALGYRFLREHRVTVGCFAKGMVRYLVSAAWNSVASVGKTARVNFRSNRG